MANFVPELQAHSYYIHENEKQTHNWTLYFPNRIYLTDLTPDNIVVNAHTLRTIFVDLDNSLIVDSTVDAETSRSPPSDWHQIHRHEQIECNGCFAYVPEEICSHHLSDLNMFSVCQVSFS